MTSDELVAFFGPEKIAELEKSGHWPVPDWLAPFILNPNPTGELTFSNTEQEEHYKALQTLVAEVQAAHS